MSINISHIGKAEAFRRLYNAANPQGLGFLHYDPAPMTLDEAESTVEERSYFDYHKGRVMKVDLAKDSFDEWLYDRDNGQGAAAAAINGSNP